MRFPGIMHLQRQVLPVGDGVANTLFLQPGERRMIVVGLTAPAVLHRPKWYGGALYIVGIL